MQHLSITDHMATPAVAPQDEMMDVFRRFSTFSPLGCYVTRDGKEMRYRIMRPARPSEFEGRCQEYLKQARLVIAVFNLPLIPAIDEFRIGDTVIEATFVLKYAPDEQE